MDKDADAQYPGSQGVLEFSWTCDQVRMRAYATKMGEDQREARAQTGWPSSSPCCASRPPVGPVDLVGRRPLNPDSGSRASPGSSCCQSGLAVRPESGMSWSHVPSSREQELWPSGDVGVGSGQRHDLSPGISVPSVEGQGLLAGHSVALDLKSRALRDTGECS